MNLYSNFKLNREENNEIPDDSGNGNSILIVDCEIVDNPCEVKNKEFSKVGKNSNEWLGKILLPSESSSVVANYTLSFFLYTSDIDNPIYSSSYKSDITTTYASAPGGPGDPFSGLLTIRDKDNICKFVNVNTSESDVYPYDESTSIPYVKYLIKNKWNHICVIYTYDIIKIFINKNLIYSTKNSVCNWNGTIYFGLGTPYYSDSTYMNSISKCITTMKGYWSDIRTYSDALTDDEVYAIYDNFGIIENQHISSKKNNIIHCNKDI